MQGGQRGSDSGRRIPPLAKILKIRVKKGSRKGVPGGV